MAVADQCGALRFPAQSVQGGDVNPTGHEAKVKAMYLARYWSTSADPPTCQRIGQEAEEDCCCGASGNARVKESHTHTRTRIRDHRYTQATTNVVGRSRRTILCACWDRWVPPASRNCRQCRCLAKPAPHTRRAWKGGGNQGGNLLEGLQAHHVEQVVG